MTRNQLDRSYISERDEESLGLLSGFFILAGLIILSIIIADVVTGFNLHNLLADALMGY